MQMPGSYHTILAVEITIAVKTGELSYAGSRCMTSLLEDFWFWGKNVETTEMSVWSTCGPHEMCQNLLVF